MIEARIERLSGEECRALEAASVSGVSFSTAVSAAAANMDVESTARCLYRRLSPVRRAKLHLLIAERLEAFSAQRVSEAAA